jgi:hypothetical protein
MERASTAITAKLPRDVSVGTGNFAWNDLCWLAAWQIQARLATLVLVGLVAVVSLWAALTIMLSWSLMATFGYCLCRQRGLPDLLENSRPKPINAPELAWMRWALLSLLKAWLVGVQAFIFSRTVGWLLMRPDRRWRARLVRVVVLGIGLTLFGVTASHHMLRKAGYAEGDLLRFSFVGSFLHVPYQILLSAAVVRAAWTVFSSRTVWPSF